LGEQQRGGMPAGNQASAGFGLAGARKTEYDAAGVEAPVSRALFMTIQRLEQVPQVSGTHWIGTKGDLEENPNPRNW
jgi:hypothetical protein